MILKLSQPGLRSSLTYWHPGLSCCDPQWEQAYLRFETPEEEIDKFTWRLRKLGAATWAKQLRVVELFCGRGNGLKALRRLGFTNLEGVDLSPELLTCYEGGARLYVGDCRELKFQSYSKDVVVIQGGLHHLPALPDDLRSVLSEVRRVLKTCGRVIVVEPWRTPYLSLVHAVSGIRPIRAAWKKLDAFATMTERELDTYLQWLSRPNEILQLLREHFFPLQQTIAYGKLMFVGQKR